jgi:hypothetical protein
MFKKKRSNQIGLLRLLLVKCKNFISQLLADKRVQNEQGLDLYVHQVFNKVKENHNRKIIA